MGRVFDLLIVDDEPSQLQLVEMLLHELGSPHRCHYAASGRKALDFLNHRPPFEQAPRPDLILLDFNMPVMSGCDVLRQLKTDPAFCSIPVIMLSNSRQKKDVDASYRERANAFIQKPMGLEENFRLLRGIDTFWANVVLLPRSTSVDS